MEDNKVLVTKEGLAELQKEYEYLVHVEREQVIEELKAARSQGDLSENADYDAARDHQARVQARISQLDEMLKNIEIIDEGKKRSRVVRLGSTVTIEFEDTKEVETYTIVGTVESDPVNGKLSNETPLASAILDHKPNDVITVLVNPPYEVKIISVE